MNREDRPLSYWTSLARIGFEEDLFRLMEKHDLNKADLADEFGASAPYITKALRGDGNFTLKTMAKLARAVGAILEVRLADEDAEVVRVMGFSDASYFDDLLSQRATSRDHTKDNVVLFDAVTRNDYVQLRGTEPVTSGTSDTIKMTEAAGG